MRKIQVKDLITVGIFAVIYMVVRFPVSFLGMVPLFNVILPVFTSFFCGPVYMLFLTKVKSPGLITLLGTLIGLFMFLSGNMWPCLAMGFVCSAVADYITYWGSYQKFKNGLAGYCVFSLWALAPLFPVWMAGDAFFSRLSDMMGEEYMLACKSYVSVWTLPLLAMGIVATSLLGGLLGRSMLKKHFERSGIA